MKTSIDLASIIYQRVKGSGVLELLGGGVYLGVRPFNSDKNDVVVATLSMLEDTLQRGNVNIKIYARDIFKDNTYYPNLGLINEAIRLLKPIFKDLYLEKERIYIHAESEHYYKVENAQEWVGVIRLITRNTN